MRELVTGDPMACSITRRPHIRLSGAIAHRQIWQLSPRLEHGCVESINQLAQYHAQIDTSTKWCHQFCSSETRFDRYAVHPKRLALQFSKPKKQSSLVEYLSFLFASFSTSYAGIPSATGLTTVSRASPHRFFNFRR